MSATRRPSCFRYSTRTTILSTAGHACRACPLHDHDSACRATDFYACGALHAAPVRQKRRRRRACQSLTTGCNITTVARNEQPFREYRVQAAAAATVHQSQARVLGAPEVWEASISSSWEGANGEGIMATPMFHRIAGLWGKGCNRPMEPGNCSQRFVLLHHLLIGTQHATHPPHATHPARINCRSISNRFVLDPRGQADMCANIACDGKNSPYHPSCPWALDAKGTPTSRTKDTCSDFSNRSIHE